MRVAILGGGQLARMLAMAAHRLDLNPLVLDPKPGCSAAAVAPTLAAAFDDPDALSELARCDLVTYEFENVPERALERLARKVPVRPCIEALHHTADRLLEKQLLRRFGLPTARYRRVDSEADLCDGVAALGLPALLKTRRLGYDGRGQRLLASARDLRPALRALGGRGLILEEFVRFEREVSLIAVRAGSGEIRFWAPTENRHRDGILQVSRAPALGLDPVAQEGAERAFAALLAGLDYVGVAVLELFVRGGAWVANEMACRVHNSGHWTLDAAATSQFENHLRAVAGLPLGCTRSLEPSAMVNLVGSLPLASRVLAVPGSCLHLYGKTPEPGRKLGHVTVTAPDVADVEHRLELVDKALVEVAAAPAWG